MSDFFSSDEWCYVMIQSTILLNCGSDYKSIVQTNKKVNRCVKMQMPNAEMKYGSVIFYYTNKYRGVISNIDINDICKSRSLSFEKAFSLYKREYPDFGYSIFLEIRNDPPIEIIEKLKVFIIMSGYTVYPVDDIDYIKENIGIKWDYKEMFKNSKLVTPESISDKWIWKKAKLWKHKIGDFLSQNKSFDPDDIDYWVHGYVPLSKRFDLSDENAMIPRNKELYDVEGVNLDYLTKRIKIINNNHINQVRWIVNKEKWTYKEYSAFIEPFNLYPTIKKFIYACTENSTIEEIEGFGFEFDRILEILKTRGHQK